MIPDTPEAAAENLRAVRLKAGAYCGQEMIAFQRMARAALAGMRVVFAAQAAGYGLDPAALDALVVFRERIAFCHRHLAIFAVRGAILTGRLPEAEEASAMARCADDDGLVSFLDEMRRIPIGFLDPPIAPPRLN